MKKRLYPLALILIAAVLTGGIIARQVPAHAAAFDSSDLIDDSVFDNSSAMTPSQIDSWINTNFPSSCISSAAGFTANDPTGYSPTTGFTYGTNVSAGRVIYDAAAAYGLNPEVLLVTLQKEQSLVSGGSGCSTLAYAGATGYGCPDSGTTHSYPAEGALLTPLYFINNVPFTSISGTCVNSVAKVGFSEQIIHAAWLLKFGEQRSEGNTAFNVQLTNAPQPGDSWNNSDDPSTCYAGPMTQGSFKRCSTDSAPVFYDGYTTIDGVSTHMDTGATAALYWYTPHFSGNQNFDNIYSAWFGSVFGNTIGPSAFQLFNFGKSQHYYTAKQGDRAFAKQYAGYSDAGTAFNVGSTQLAGMVPVYSSYNGRINDHWLTVDGISHYWALNFGGYRDDGIAFYAYPPNANGAGTACSQGTPVYALWQGGHSDHFYTTSELDRYWALIFGGYVDDHSTPYSDNTGNVAFCVPS